MIFQPNQACTKDADHLAFPPDANTRAGVIVIAILSFTVLHVCSQRPHPTHRSSMTTKRNDSKSMASASVGQRETQA